VKNTVFFSHLFRNEPKLKTNTVVVVDNYVDAAKWCALTGPNDERMGPRFVPITEPFDLADKFATVAESKKHKIKLPKVTTVCQIVTLSLSSSDAYLP